MTEVVSFIFARGGSRGLRDKNILDFAGKPLIAWTIEQALENPRIQRVIVSTDSPEIADISRAHGADVPFLRPAELASDTSSELLSWKHALNFLKDSEGTIPEIFLSLPCTAPLRQQDDINRNLDCLIENNGDIAISVSASLRSPYFNMVQLDGAGQASLVLRPEKEYVRRQDVPKTFDLTTVAYSSRSQYILQTDDLMAGKVFASIVDRDRAIDIDDALDFEVAEFLFKKKSGKK
ncbi:N-acylneuraminate cytidylyltransferase [Candidatus Planktophila dulcis]|uniref:N-acylneuraminate cytidylyltransferase n=1 Tax=Candidatus Planktophila dulcis TaxID=1884914 RepID=A0AAC9YT18_9ACTN|nr:acylneuraminate cytidylyltransferase family protein [Candidatus Planktophila dulcis]ASY11442.1 N-acylneuraminate cytidylyltransferase [Candidatus Planktophila dulcis]